MQPKRPSLTRLFAVGLVLAMTAGACVTAPARGVGVKNVTADLVFGVPPLPEPAGPPGIFPDLSPDAFPDLPPPTLRPLPPLRGEPPAPTTECPFAKVTDAPEAEATTSVPGPPLMGTYRWKLSGHEIRGGARMDFEGFVERQIKEVVGDRSRTFTFKTVEVDPRPGSTAIITSTFEVNQTAQNAGLARTNAAVRGVRLMRIETDPRDGRSPVSVFQPDPPIRYLPLPFRTGGTAVDNQRNDGPWEDTGVDPRSLQTLTHLGIIRSEQMHVDACGRLIAAWIVDATQTHTINGAQVKRRFVYAIATQYGGLIVYEHSRRPCAEFKDGKCTPDPTLVYETSIGKVPG